MKKIIVIGVLILLLFGCIFSAGCTYTSTELQQKNYPIIGGWEAQLTDNGNPLTLILTVNKDGSCYYMVLGEKPNSAFTKAVELNWVKKDDATYEFTSDDGQVYSVKYNAETDTLLGKYSFTRLDPLVGVWVSVGTQPGNRYKSTSIIKPNGTGVETTASENGPIEEISFTWQKSDNDTYTINYSNGQVDTISVNDLKDSIIINQVVTKRKVFENTTFFFAVTGPWYNEEKQWAMMLSGDGSGFIKTPTVTYPLTWQNDSLLTFKTQYLEGLGLDGHTLMGKTFTWTYNFDNDTITNSNGDVFVHTPVSIPGMITIT